ncbi:MAG: beta-propeller fold lactonase family protein, partial [Flavobacteriales bacterium]|nr:beta-propeller fold lactonase family protein [Flavobacteriales bacterium]
YSNSMQVFNISDPAAPTLSATIATGSGPWSVAVSGSHAYVVNTSSNSMQVFNISDPAAPTLTATIATGWGPTAVAVSGSHAYLVHSGSNSMMVYNISNPAAPSLSATIATGSAPWSVAVSGSNAYVMNRYDNTMQVFNLFCPPNMVTIDPVTGEFTTQPLTGLTQNGSAAGNTPYWNGTQWVTNSSNIFNNGGNVGMGTNTPANRLDVEGGLAVGGSYSGSTAAPANGAIIEGNVGMGTTTPANRLDVEGGLAVGGSYSGSTAAPANGAIIEGNVGMGTTTPANRLDVEGGLAVGSSYSGSTVAPANGAIIEGNVGIGTTTPANKLDVEGRLAVGSSYSGSTVAPANGAIIEGNVGIGTATPAAKLDVAGTVKIADGTQGTGKLLTSDAQGNASWQALSPESIFGSGSVPGGAICLNSLATVATGWGPLSVAFSGNNAYVVSQYSNSMQVFNISDPAAPTLSATIATGSTPWSVAISGSQAYVVNYGSSNMMVFNISNPAAPTLSATIATGSGPASVAVSGSNAYVVNYNSATMQVFNISNPAVPTLSATIATGSQPRSLAVSGSHAYVVNQSSSTMQVFNISNPAAPTLSATIATGSNPQSVAVSGSHAFVVNATSNTMQVFNLFCPPNMVTIDPVTGEFTAQQLAGLTQNGSAAGNTPYWNGTQWVANSSNIFNNGGNVGIGTTNPIAPLHVVPNGSNSYSSLPITFFNYGSVLQNINWVPVTMAGYFQGNLMVTQAVMTTNGALTVSDRRLKKIVGRTDTEEDLAVLDRIQVTDYTFIDSITQGNSVQKKVIAQELEEVYPNAIRYNQDHIPDIYSLSSAVRSAEGKLVVTLAKPHGLVQGDQLKWIEENGTEHFDSVSCVIDAHTFELPSAEPRSRIFVWGRKVNDLRTVDYDAVTMLNVSATQALHKLVRALQERNEALEQRNSLLDAELEGMRAQLEANTALMLKLQSVLDAQTRK